ncbi:unnamed protein product [Boreogadus saida]
MNEAFNKLLKGPSAEWSHVPRFHGLQRNTEEQRCPVRAAAGTSQQAHQALETRVLLSKDERRTPGRLLLRRGGCGEASGARLTYSSSSLRGSVTWGHAPEQSWRANDPRSLLGLLWAPVGPGGAWRQGGGPQYLGDQFKARGVLWDLAGDFSQAAKRACLPPSLARPTDCRGPSASPLQGHGTRGPTVDKDHLHVVFTRPRRPLLGCGLGAGRLTVRNTVGPETHSSPAGLWMSWSPPAAIVEPRPSGQRRRTGVKRRLQGVM